MWKLTELMHIHCYVVGSGLKQGQRFISNIIPINHVNPQYHVMYSEALSSCVWPYTSMLCFSVLGQLPPAAAAVAVAQAD